MAHRVEVKRRAPVRSRWSTVAPKTGQSRLLEQSGKRVPAGTEVAVHLHKVAIGGDAMSICGVITTKDVLRHGATIVREFGTLAYLRCCVAILVGRKTTFLNCVCELR